MNRCSCHHPGRSIHRRNFLADLGLGFTAQIGEHFGVSIDAFRVDVDDRITLSERVDCFEGNVPDAALAQPRR